MIPLEREATVLVSGEFSWEIRVGGGASIREIKVTLSRDGLYDWTFSQPGWRPLSFGCGGGVSYVWSARSVIVLPAEANGEPALIDVDEDLLFVFRRGDCWILVCEASVRLLRGVEELARVELDEVVKQARWEDGVLLIHQAEGRSVRVSVEEGDLSI